MDGIEAAEGPRDVGEPGPNWLGVSKVLLPLALRKGAESPSFAVYCSGSDPNGDIGDPGERRWCVAEGTPALLLMKCAIRCMF